MIKSLLLLITIMLYCLCNSCSRSGHRKVNDRNELATASERKNIVPIEKINDVYQIRVAINGIPMHFIFDTGAGMISISETEALFLYKQGTLTSDDIKGTSNFSDANGGISEGTVINLKKVTIGSRTLQNVPASVVHNLQAPLLFGESALEQFGKVSIDYRLKEVTFE